jgi:hypothetical protein
VVRLVEWHDREIPRTEKSIRRALRHLGELDFRRLLALKRADNLAQAPEFRERVQEWDRAEEILDQLLAEDTCFSLKQLAVNGGDMMRLGITGRPIGVILNTLLDTVVNGELPNERAALLKAAEKEMYEHPELAERIVYCRLTTNTVAALRYALFSPSTKMFSFDLTEKDELSFFTHACEKYLLHHLERDFNTLNFYKSLFN